MGFCFLIGATGIGVTKTGEALIGSVSDDPYDVRTFMKRVNSSTSYSHIGTELISTSDHTLTERGYFARPGETTRGINASGLAFTCAMIIENSENGVTDDVTSYADITAALMKGYRTVDEAITFFKSQGAISPAYSVLLADADGGLAHIEVGRYGTSILHHYSAENPGMVFAVNCYLTESLAKYNDPKSLISDPRNNNGDRRQRGEELAHTFQGEITVDTIAKILSDHKNDDRDPRDNPVLPAWGYSICNHGTRKKNSYPYEDLPWGTVSGEIMQPSELLFWYAYGWPCGGKPKYGDQIFQDKSWGSFKPFGFDESNVVDGVTHLTTPEGDLSPV